MQSSRHRGQVCSGTDTAVFFCLAPTVNNASPQCAVFCSYGVVWWRLHCKTQNVWLYSSDSEHKTCCMGTLLLQKTGFAPFSARICCVVISRQIFDCSLRSRLVNNDCCKLGSLFLTCHLILGLCYCCVKDVHHDTHLSDPHRLTTALMGITKTQL